MRPPLGSFPETCPNPIQAQRDLVRVHLKKREDHHAGDRDIEPDGKGDNRDAAVQGEAAGQREKECGEHHGQGDDGEDNVAGQDGKVERAHRAVAGENRIAVQRVAHDVADEKRGREDEGQQHAGAMSIAVTMFDEIQAHAKSSRAEAVEQGVEGGQKHPAAGEIGRSVMHVKQPQQE